MRLLDFFRPPAGGPLAPALKQADMEKKAVTVVYRDVVVNHADPGIEWLWRRAGYAEMYRSQIWVTVVVNKLARGIARLPLKVYRDVGEERMRVRSGGLVDLIDAPAPGWFPFRLKEATVADLLVHGNALWRIRRPRAGATPTGLNVVPWERVTVNKTADVFTIRHEGRTERVMAGDVVHFRWWSTGGAPDGMSPLEPLRNTLELEHEASTAALGGFRNKMRPGGALETDRTLEPDQKQELRDEIDLAYVGAANSGRPMLLDNGLKWVSHSQTNEAAQLVEHRKLTREEVAAALDIPPPLIGILDKATFSNISEQHRMLYMDTMGPPLALLEETIQAQLIRQVPEWDGVFCEFDLAEVMKGDVKERSEAYQRYLQSGVMTPNELRRLENLPPVADPRADALLLPLNMQAVHPDLPAQEEATNAD